MKTISCKLIYFLLLAQLLFPAFSNAQNSKFDLQFVTGNILLNENFKEEVLNKREEGEVVNGKFYRIIQFYELPGDEEVKKLELLGVKLLQYIPNKAYFASISLSTTYTKLAGFNIRAISPMEKEMKLSLALLNNDYPAWAVTGNEIQLIVQYFGDVQPELAKWIITGDGIGFVSAYEFSKQLTVQMPICRINELAAIPIISYIEPVDPPAVPDNNPGKTSHRSNVLNSEFSTGRKYDGTGVVVAMGDDGIIGPHIDYHGRVDQTAVTNNTGDHGDHVAGTIMGAGNINPNAKGMAPGSFLYVYSVWNAVNSTPTSYYSNNVRITSTSYSNGCNAGYTSFARTADQQTRLMPELIHVFSAGNSGTTDCNYGAGSNWGNVTGGVKVGKNVIAVANLTSTDGLSSTSSRGPASDGRIKPDISAVGSSVLSTIDEHSYSVKSGTSMACPGVSGTLAQLYHAYKDLNNGQNPPSALMKAIILNTADDLGNPGPDYRFGYGRINAFRAVKAIEEARYLQDSISHSANKTHTINVPAGTKQLRVMVYWHDYEAAANASKALVNNINMHIVDPSNNLYNPWVLDHTPNATSLNANAVRGIDSLNNVEQVTIENPASGNYIVHISGQQIPFGPQRYFVVYEVISDEISITYPIGGESFVPGETEIIRWDAYGNTGNFTLQYSTNNGATWLNISTSVNGANRHFNWSVPNLNSGQIRVRVVRGSLSSASNSFSIINVPTNLQITNVCADRFTFSWNAVSGANGYIVTRLGEKYMDSVGTSTSTSFTVNGALSTEEHWVSVQAMGNNGAVGRRAIAIMKQPGISNCLLPDLELSAIISPISGCNNINESVQVDIRNNGNSAVTNFSLGYKYDTLIVTETFNGIVPGQSSVTYTFNTRFDYLAPGTQNLMAWVSYPNDYYSANDTFYNHEFETFPLPEVTIVPEIISCTPGAFALNAVSGAEVVNWLSSFGQQLHTGKNFNTPNLTSNTKYFVQAFDHLRFNTGAPSNTIGNGSYVTFLGTYNLSFDAKSSFTLDSVTVYANSTGSLKVVLRDNNQVVVDSAVVLVTQSGANRLYLGFSVVPGSGYELAIDDFTVTGLYRNTSGASFPYAVKGVMEITGSNFTNPNYYYFFYDWKITLASCLGKLNPIDIYIEMPQAQIVAGQVFEGNFNSGTLSFPDEVCEGSILSYELQPPSGNNIAGYGQQWEITQAIVTGPGNQLVQGVQFIAPTGSNNALLLWETNYSNPDDYKLMVTYKLNYGCDTTIVRAIRLNPNPIASYSYQNSCVGDSIFFINSSSVANGNINSHSWEIDGVFYNDFEPVVIMQNNGNYDISLTVSSDKGCVVKSEGKFMVYPLPNVLFSSPEKICEGEKVLFQNYTFGTRPMQFSWIFSDSLTAIDENPEVQFLYPGEYNVQLIVQTAQGCSDSFSREMLVTPTPTADFTFNFLTMGKVQFTPNDSNYNAYNWNFGDGNASTEKSPMHVYAANDEYQVELSVIDINTCIGQNSKKVVVVNISPNSVKKNDNAHIVQVYPNPFRTGFMVGHSPFRGEVNMQVTDALGRLVYSETKLNDGGEGNYNVDLEHAGPGIYFLKIQMGKQDSIFKLVKIE